MSTKTIYTVYKTTNILNNKIYIGVHKQPEDEPVRTYMGSGTHLTRSIKKYGKENFTKEILFIFDNDEDMHLMEEVLVDFEFIERNDTYNLQTGGGSRGILSIASKKKISDTLIEGYASGRIPLPTHCIGVVLTEEHKTKIKNTLIKRYEEIEHHRAGCDPWNKGLIGVQDAWNKGLKMGPHSKESNKQRSITLKKRYETHDGNRKGFAPWNKGIANPYAKTDHMNVNVECVHCGKIANTGNHARWHGDNCKYNSKD